MTAFRLPRATLGVFSAAVAGLAAAQSAEQPVATVLDPVVVTASRAAERAYDVPAAIGVGVIVNVSL